MTRIIAAAVLLLFVIPAAWGLEAAQLRGLSDAELAQQVRIYRCTGTDMDILLPELQRRFPAFDDRVKILARMYLGAPYVTDPLTGEEADWLPYASVNCTMYVLYVEAFANSRCMAEAREHMRLLHYRGGTVGFAQRYHFTEDRITDPANIYFADITGSCVRDARSLRTISLELNRKKDGALLFGDRLGRWSKKVSLQYIPKSGFAPGSLLPLPRVTGVAFVEKENWKNGLAVGHEGLLIEGDLYHSSLKRGVVIEKNFLAVGFPASAWEGMIFYTLKQQKASVKPARCGQEKAARDVPELDFIK